VLDRWDYELNNRLPNEILYATHEKYYFKCPRGLHTSEFKLISSFTSGQEGSIECDQCNSIAQFGIDNLGKDFFDKYWSNKNTMDSWKYAKNSHQQVWWKCPEKIHDDYFREISNSNSSNFRCPECQYSKGEERINEYFIKKGFIKINQDEFEQLVDKDKYNKNYIPQKEFDGLMGLGNGLLSYDFYSLKHNLLIEYQGEQHERYIPGFHKSKKDFEKQLEHDKRKKEYANKHNIKLLEIWYYDFDNIESILQKELNL